MIYYPYLYPYGAINNLALANMYNTSLNQLNDSIHPYYYGHHHHHGYHHYGYHYPYYHGYWRRHHRC